MTEEPERWVVEVNADTEPLQRELARVSTLGEQFGRSLTRSFEGLVLHGRSFGDVLRSLGQRLAQLSFQAAFKPLETGIGGFLENLFSGALTMGNANNIRAGGRALPIPFASGGVVAAPTFFPLNNGRMGLMGEAGAEAILPLRRGSDGRLGVAAQGSGGMAITFNVTSPNAESFARSEAQIAAMLARTVSRGQRVL
ncbi:MAG: phage tail tape measure protein [Pseudomonadota bacterium]